MQFALAAVRSWAGNHVMAPCSTIPAHSPDQAVPAAHLQGGCALLCAQHCEQVVAEGISHVLGPVGIGALTSVHKDRTGDGQYMW
jgi:hypothetical protein